MIASNHPLAPTHLPSITLRIAHRSDPGCVRTVNEDSYLIYEPKDPFVQASRGKFVVLSDGMGGAVGGDKASRLVVKATKEAYYDESRDQKVSESLIDAIKRANLAVYEYARQNEAYQGMAATCTALAFHGRFLHFGHVGDSRLYLIRDHRILQLTDDHSKVDQIMKAAIPAPPDTSQRKLGLGPSLKIDTPPHPLELRAGDRLLLCSDGLTTHVGDVEMLRLIDQRDPRQATDRFIELAKARGGSDNITLLVIQVVQVVSPAARAFNAPIVATAPAQGQWTPPPPSFAARDRRLRQWRSTFFAVAVVLSMAALAFYIHDRWGDRQPADESTVAVSEKAGSTGDKEGSEKLSLAREAPVRDEAGAAAKREASAEAGASEGDSQAKGTDEVKTDILSPDPNAPDVEDEAFPEATLSEDETEPELRAPSQSGRAQIIRGRALSKAIIRVDNPKGPLCKDLKKMIAEKLGLKGFSTEDFVQTVARYQMKNGLDVVGHPGPQTRKALFGYDLRRKVCAKRPKPSGDNPPE